MLPPTYTYVTVRPLVDMPCTSFIPFLHMQVTVTVAYTPVPAPPHVDTPLRFEHWAIPFCKQTPPIEEWLVKFAPQELSHINYPRTIIRRKMPRPQELIKRSEQSPKIDMKYPLAQELISTPQWEVYHASSIKWKSPL